MEPVAQEIARDQSDQQETDAFAQAMPWVLLGVVLLVVAFGWTTFWRRMR